MKATGVVRRIDDLGRVVIPKELRKKLRIREGEPIEIFVEGEGEVILKKYSPVGELKKTAEKYVSVLAEATGLTASITDRDAYVVSSDPAKTGKMIEDEHILNVLENTFTTKTDTEHSQIISPIIANGDTIGSVVLSYKEGSEKWTTKLAETVAKIIGKQLED